MRRLGCELSFSSYYFHSKVYFLNSCGILFQSSFVIYSNVSIIALEYGRNYRMFPQFGFVALGGIPNTSVYYLSWHFGRRSSQVRQLLNTLLVLVWTRTEEECKGFVPSQPWSRCLRCWQWGSQEMGHFPPCWSNPVDDRQSGWVHSRCGASHRTLILLVSRRLDYILSSKIYYLLPFSRWTLLSEYSIFAADYPFKNFGILTNSSWYPELRISPQFDSIANDKLIDFWEEVFSTYQTLVSNDTLKHYNFSNACQCADLQFLLLRSWSWHDRASLPNGKRCWDRQ